MNKHKQITRIKDNRKLKTMRIMLRTLHHPIIKPFISLSFILALSLLFRIEGSQFIYAGCSQVKYPPNSVFETNINSLLSSLLSSSAQALYNNFAIGNETSPDSAAYGLYQCRGDLKFPACTKCVQNVIIQIGLVCPYSYGASLQLDTCFLRYEHTDFFGILDTSLRYKKCGKHVSGDAEFFKRRDDVFAELEGESGFRVSRSGFIEGYGQCMGDLSPDDCSACLTDAVSKLKSLCGNAATVDIYLGQCYARYWASGYYNNASDSSNDDGVGKMVAIIVGSVAGLSIVIVLLSMCRKSLVIHAGK